MRKNADGCFEISFLLVDACMNRYSDNVAIRPSFNNSVDMEMTDLP